MENMASNIRKAYQALRRFKPAKSAMFSHSNDSSDNSINTPKPTNAITI